MCGIAGILDERIRGEELCRGVERMQKSLFHRGPDDSGIWADESAGIALAHRRLSILDISPAGHQPMHSLSGRYVIVFNGEIYNHDQIRIELENIASRQWRGHSDTEYLLEAFETWGVHPTLKRLIGMFAIALWDRQERVLHLMRDRVGEKPLYYGRVGSAIVFASELKALRKSPSWSGRIDRNALMLFLRFNYVPAPFTIYEGIRKLQPGTVLSLTLDSPEDVDPVPYWSALEAAERGILEPFSGSEDEAVAHLNELLGEAVRQQMVADVPLGAFLSGGVDSSAIVALMQSQSSRPVKTFTIGFQEAGYNEAEDAKKVARYLRTEHTELYIDPAEALSVIPRLPVLYDEPFADVSQIPTFLVSQLTRKHVTVSLSGDGGDELFAGYNRYFWVRSIWDRIGHLPAGMRSILARGLLQVSPRSWDSLHRLCSPIIPPSLRQKTPGDKLHKLAGILEIRNPDRMYIELVSQWKDPNKVLRNGCGHAYLPPEEKLKGTNDIALQMMYLDLMTFLPDDILVKVDRAAMGVSLETRVPFLDHRVIEFAWRIPLSMKIREGKGKWILRQLLYNYVPRELIERPKSGFAVPIDSWLRGPLRDWAESLLGVQRVNQEGYFDHAEIEVKWREHLSGKKNWQYHLWNILMFQSWLESTKGEC